MVDNLLSGKASGPMMEVSKTAVAEKWSVTRDLAEAFERLGRLAVLVGAERADQIENVEDELFRFGRTLDANPRLASLLSQVERPVEGRIGLLDNVLGGKPTSFTTDLLRQTVRLLNGRNIVDVVPELAELAAERRGESVAHVVAAAPLSRGAARPAHRRAVPDLRPYDFGAGRRRSGRRRRTADHRRRRGHRRHASSPGSNGPRATCPSSGHPTTRAETNFESREIESHGGVDDLIRGDTRRDRRVRAVVLVRDRARRDRHRLRHR